ncbi:uncharacterized protein LOC103994122 [Musa acuminata AAA Group]|uniref:uncharacterized protein LOC103994122 n=1 Tax=Musa acuminata AAA Group TaxID=214697 RepID=UPI0031CFF3AC
MSVRKKPLLKPFFVLLLFLSFLLFFHLYLQSKKTPISSAIVPSSTAALIRIRPGFRSYDDYIKLQLNKTLNPRLRHLWATRDWDRKIRVFSRFFADLAAEGLLSNASAALCVGARLGQEVAALRGLGVGGALGMDLVPAPPLVVAGDFHAQPFPDESFDFEFSNVFDHALYPERFAAEVERTLRPGGVAVLHLAVHRRGDKYSANDLLGGVDGLVALFNHSEVVRVRKVDGFGLDTEVVLRKTNTKSNKPTTKSK